MIWASVDCLMRIPSDTVSACSARMSLMLVRISAASPSTVTLEATLEDPPILGMKSKSSSRNLLARLATISCDLS